MCPKCTCHACVTARGDASKASRFVSEWLPRQAMMVREIREVWHASRADTDIFYLVTRGKTWNPDMSDLVTKLDLQLARKFPAWNFEVMQLPGRTLEDLSSFVDPKVDKRIWVNPDAVIRTQPLKIPSDSDLKRDLKDPDPEVRSVARAVQTIKELKGI